MTIDRSQGLDKAVIVLSLVRSNADGNVGKLLQDWKRVNVALTRAQSKLVVIGSAKTLTASEDANLVHSLIERCNERGFTLTLPKEARAEELERVVMSASENVSA